MLRQASGALSLFFLAGCVTASSTSRTTSLMKFVNVNGVTRTYALYVPASFRPEAGLVILLHGRGGNGQSVSEASGMNAKADEKGFIVAYPDALGKPALWNASRNPQKPDDVAFIEMMMQDITRKYSIDPRRIYVGGYSSGAYMTYRLGMDLGDRIAAMAVVAGAMDWPLPSIMDGSDHPVSLIAFHGDNDRTVPIETARAAIRFWIEADRTIAEPVRRTNESGSVVQEIYVEGGKAGNGGNGAEIVVFTLKGGTHTWPRNFRWDENGMLPPLDEKAQSAIDVIWNFFESHPKQSERMIVNRIIRRSTR